MKYWEMACAAWLAMGCAGCLATINAYPPEAEESDNVALGRQEDDAGSPAAEPDAVKPREPPDQSDAGTMPPMAAMPVAGSMPPMPAMPVAGSQSPPAAPACDFRALLQAKCGNASCHGAPATSTGLDLTSPSLAMRTAGRKGPSACSSHLLIDPANPSESALYLKVSGTTCGSRMPLGGTLSASEQACILSWIEAL